MRRFVCGDIHGSVKGLIQALERANFDYEKDLLITLGDYVDGWSDVKEVIDELLKIKNLVHLIGNHDDWCLKYYTGQENYPGFNDPDFNVWRFKYGMETLNSFGSELDQKYLKFFNSCKDYYILEDKIFAHAEIPSKSFVLEICERYQFIWNRYQIKDAYIRKDIKDSTSDDRWNEIYLGHTPVSNFNKYLKKPQKWTNIWAMDTSAAFKGCVTLMDIDSKDVFQSNECFKLYPDEKGRNSKSYNWYIKNNVNPYSGILTYKF